VDTIEKIDALKEKLLSQKTDLEDQKSKLETQKQDLELQQQNLNDLLEQKKQEADYNEAEIQEAQEQADQISALVQKQQEVEAAVSVEQETSSATTVTTTTEEETPSVVEEVPAQTENYTPATPQCSGSGQAIVSYAMQFLGCPYVWGGNSLTQGCDCSHFVWLVLRDSIGYSAGYCISDGFCYVGSPVNSLAEAQAGDIIVYPGHVAIYDGAGLIVEAKGSAYGITHDRPADHGAQILAIRRVV
jgi:cell wall-associated NlpC family hydrolase